MKTNGTSNLKISLGMGLLSGITWGLDSTLLGIILAMSPFIDGERAILLAPLVSTFLHDGFSAIWLSILMAAKGQFSSIFTNIKTKSGKFIAIGALLGGPVGMTGYLLAIKYIGPAYTASISAVYPAIGAMLAFIFLREKLSLKSWFGLLISIISIVLLGHNPGGSDGSNYLLGFFFAIVCVFGWASESVIAAYGMKSKQITPQQAFHIRQCTSALFYGIIILPLMNAHFLTISSLTSKPLPWLVIAALLGTLSCVLWYATINKIGASRGMALNITYVAWAMIFQVLILHSPITLKLVVCSIAIMVGSVLAASGTHGESHASEPAIVES